MQYPFLRHSALKACVGREEDEDEEDEDDEGALRFLSLPALFVL
jgi:hypothetical protein